jgi:hypothetical protein
VTADSAWIETCPDKLFYNPHSQICDWDTIEKMTTTIATTTAVRNHAVLVKFKPRTDSVGTVGRMAVDTQVIQDADFAAVSPRSDVILTIAPTRPAVAASAVVVPSTSVDVTSATVSSVAAEEQIQNVPLVTPALEVIQVPHQVVAVAGMQSTTPRAEFVLPPVVETTAETVVVASSTPRDDLEVISTTVSTPVSVVEVTRAPVVVTVTPVAPVVVVEATTVEPLVAESVDHQAQIQRQQLQQRVAELQQELMRVQQQVQQSVVATTTPVARFVMQ